MLRLSVLTRAASLAVLAAGFSGLTALADGGAVMSLGPARYDPARPLTQSYFIYDAAPGETIRDEVRLRNGGTESGTVQLYAVDGTTGQTSGAVYLSESDPRRDVGTWIELERRELTLGAGEDRRVAFTVRIPADASPGQHLGGIVAENNAVKNDSPEGSALQVSLRTRAATAVQVNLPGATVERLTVTGITPSGERGYQTLLLGLRNDGTEMVKPTGTIIVASAQGQQVQAIAFQLDTFLPRTEIQYPVHIEHQALGPGEYDATVQLSYGRSGAATYQTAFTLTPVDVAQIFEARPPLQEPGPTASALEEVRKAPPTTATVAAFIFIVLITGFAFYRFRHPGRAATGQMIQPVVNRPEGQTERESLAPRRILVADDDDVLRETLSEILRLEGYDVESAPDGMQALRAVLRTRPALVLLDMRMPILDGWEFAREIDARGLDVPIVVMSAAVNPSVAAREIEADGWIEKPFNLEELLPTIDRLAA